jgi:hypothetical protein
MKHIINGKINCSSCKVSKPLSDFHKDKYKKHGVRSWCKKCDSNKENTSKERRRETIANNFADYFRIAR